MTPALTLLSLACAIANKGQIDTSSIESQLNDGDKTKIEEIIQSGACLPANFEKLILETKALEKAGDARLIEIQSHSAPSDHC